MTRVLVFAGIASSALVLGSLWGTWRPPPKRVSAALLAFASGALITAMAFDLFQEGFQRGGALRSGAAFLVGATVYIVTDSWLERRLRNRREKGLAVGIALLAAVTLDGVPENLALGVSLIDQGSVVLLVAIFASNLPESLVGAQRMREGQMSPRAIIATWVGAALLLMAALVVGYVVFRDFSPRALTWPLGFAGGAVLASLADTLMPQAFEEGGPFVAYATALGFLLTFLLASLAG